MNAQVIDGVGIRVDVALFHKVAWDETVAVVAHADGVCSTRGDGTLGERGRRAVARGLYARDGERYRTDIAEYEVVVHRVTLIVRAEVVLLAL